MADGRKWLWIRAALVTLVCALLVVPVLVATALDEDDEPQTAARPRRAGPEEPPATTAAPTATTLAPTPTTTEHAPEEPPPAEPPPETAPPRVVEPPAVVAPAPEPEVGIASDCGGGGDVAGLHNAVRCERGLGGLVHDAGLSANAQGSANRLLGAGSCAAITHSELAAVYAGRSFGENLGCVSSAGCSGSFGSLMASWMASPGHAENIVNPAYARIGYASACDGRNTYFVVHFTS